MGSDQSVAAVMRSSSLRNLLRISTRQHVTARPPVFSRLQQHPCFSSAAAAEEPIKVIVEEASEDAVDPDAGLKPHQIVEQLDRFIVGQADAKRAVAIALRNRWRRHRLPEELRDEV